MVLCGQQHSCAVVSHVASQQEGPCPCMGFLQASSNLFSNRLANCRRCTSTSVAMTTGTVSKDFKLFTKDVSNGCYISVYYALLNIKFYFLMYVTR